MHQLYKFNNSARHMGRFADHGLRDTAGPAATFVYYLVLLMLDVIITFTSCVHHPRPFLTSLTSSVTRGRATVPKYTTQPTRIIACRVINVTHQ